MDEVLADLTTVLIEYYNKKDKTLLTVEDCKSYNLGLLWDKDRKGVVDRVFEFYRSDEFLGIKPVEGSIRGIDYLFKKYDLYVITSRPTWLRKKTVEWVEKYFPNKFKEVILTNQASIGGDKKKKSQVGKEIGIKYLIEDHMDYVMDAYEEGIGVFVKDMPWNREEELPDSVVRFYDWKEIEKYL